MLGEVIVHGQDITRPLGPPLVPARAAVHIVARFFAGKDFAVNSRTLVRGPRLVRSLRLVATDDALVHGGGPEVHGTILNLAMAMAMAMAMAGRTVALDELEGAGVATLQERLSRP